MRKFFTILGCAFFAMGLVACDKGDEGKEHINTVVIDFEDAEFGDKVATSPATWTFMQEGYSWQDAATSLSHSSIFTFDYGYAIYGGGLTLSRYNTSDVVRFSTYESDLYAYNSKNDDAQSGGGANGSDTFLIAYGNYDPNVDAELDLRPTLTFADGVARRIVSCKINSTAYFVNIAENGNPFSPAMKDGEEIRIYATGYDAQGREGKTISMSFARKGDLIKQWTTWNLAELGKVLTVKFNILGGNSNEWGMTTPKYFAIDDIAVEQELKTD